jgi:hypothetical protein
VTVSDRDAIIGAAADYIESWLAGDAERMRRCLHPELAKRSVSDRDPQLVDQVSATEMVRATGEGSGKKYRAGHEVEIFDINSGMATVKVTSVPYVEYLHLARFGDEWLIVNVLWTRRHGDAATR